MGAVEIMSGFEENPRPHTAIGKPAFINFGREAKTLPRRKARMLYAPPLMSKLKFGMDQSKTNKAIIVESLAKTETVLRSTDLRSVMSLKKKQTNVNVVYCLWIHLRNTDFVLSPRAAACGSRR